MRNTADVTGGKPIAVLLESIAGVSAINPLDFFYDIHGRNHNNQSRARGRYDHWPTAGAVLIIHSDLLMQWSLLQYRGPIENVN
jgi:hypothetical protein